MITVSQPDETLDEVLEAFRSTAGADKPAFLQVHLAYAESEREARMAAYAQWRQNVHPSSVLTEIRTVEQMSSLGEKVRPEDIDNAVRISGPGALRPHGLIETR